MISTEPLNTADSEARRLATRQDTRRPVVEGVFRTVVTANGGRFSTDAGAAEGLDAYARSLANTANGRAIWPGTSASVARQYALLHALTALGARNVQAGNSFTYGDFLTIPGTGYALALGRGLGCTITDLDGMHYAHLFGTGSDRPAMEVAQLHLDWIAAHPAQ